MNTQAVTEQAPAPSVEERAADLLFGSLKKKAAPAAPPNTDPPETEEAQAPNAEVTEEPEAATGDEPIAEDTFEFEHEGEKWVLPKKLEKALHNNRDYTQKTQELANQRRVIEAANEQARIMNLTRDFEGSIADERQQLAAFDSVLSQPLDPNQSQEDLLRAMVQRNQWEKQRDAVARSIHGKYQEYLSNHEKAQADLKAKSLEAVSKRIPGWNDAMWGSIREHAKADGYTDTELGAINDPRHQITLWKAQQFDLLKSKATKSVADVKAVKVTPSASSPMPQHVKDKLAFHKALSKTSDPVAKKHLIEGRVGSLFRK